jgi:hypothetical protein
MSTTIPASHVQSYSRMAHLVFQRPGQFLKEAVRFESGIVGKSHTFQKIGSGIATTKARHGNITPMDLTHTAHTATLEDFYAPEYVAPTDIMRILHDENSAVMKSGLYALGRKIDSQITTLLDATSQTTVSWTVTSSATVRNALLEMVEDLDNNEIPDDGQRYGALTPRAWSMAMTVDEFASADFVGPDGLPYTQGAPIHARWKSWNGVMWKQHGGLPGKGTATAKVFTWHKNALGYAAGSLDSNVAASDTVSAKVDWVPEKYEWLINHVMAGGGVVIDDQGIIEGNLDDTASIPTS